MLRAVSSICIESQALELFATGRRDVYKLFRTCPLSTASQPPQTVLRSSVSSGEAGPACPPPAQAPPPHPPPPPSPPAPQRRPWALGAAALALTASLGGVYYYRKLSDEKTKVVDVGVSQEAAEAGPAWLAPAEAGPAWLAPAEAGPAWLAPAAGAEFPSHVQYLLVGAGTASFAAMRAIRSHRPEAQVLIVGDEPALPYMRPPLSKELWREPALATADLAALTFRQWNGKRRPVAYEPAAFYLPVAQLASAPRGGASVARGWRVTELDVAARRATLRAPGREPVTLTYGKALVATGVRPRRLRALRTAAAQGRSLALRGLADLQRLAAALEAPGCRRVAVLGGGFLATELSAALADRLQGTDKSVTQLYREEAPLAAVLPAYLAAEAARRLRRAGVALRGRADVVAADVEPAGAVRLRLADGGAFAADLVVECVGSEFDPALAAASALETHAALGGLAVTAELQARADVWAAGDAACYHDVALGRRRVEHHDHAVASGRRAGTNMADVGPQQHYDHQSMFWSDLGPHGGYEAIGIIDSQLQTVGVFSADAVEDEREAAPQSAKAAPQSAEAAPQSAEAAACARRYARGVVFYVRERRVVGVLLWNLFNRMHVARQVLARGSFDDLFEVAKLFDLHEDD